MTGSPMLACGVGLLTCAIVGCGAENQRAAELRRERAAASYAPPPPAVLAAAGSTRAARNARARAELLIAAKALMSYHRAHGTYAVGPVANLHRLDPRTTLVDFVDGRKTGFFIAVEPPSTKQIWRYNFDHERASRSCEPPTPGVCPAGRHW
ncbi:MAG: hypothetical protein NVSMB25_22800 [Thermoleophilaceae bacterium]